MTVDGRTRVVIERVQPEIDAGAFPIKRVVGETVEARAAVFCDGHDVVSAILLYRLLAEPTWRTVQMESKPDDWWQASFVVERVGTYVYSFEAWVDHFKTWQTGLRRKADAKQDVKTELLIGSDLVRKTAARATASDAAALERWADTLAGTQADLAMSAALGEDLAHMMQAYPDRSSATKYEKDLEVDVDRIRALFSAWYEFFPRSFSSGPGRHGTLKDCERLLPEIARMGFDIVYLPPIHPIGVTNRKGKNNSPICEPGDPGSPWAIGSAQGGHKALHPELGTLDDFASFIERTRALGMEVAIDIAFQASPDHPYVKAHPGWFKWRPDGSVQHAENPPKKYEDVLPFNFEGESWRELWAELKSVFVFWIEKGIHVFRVDNPHTKPIGFWEWVLSEIRKDHPEVLFLSEAFTRPKVMYRLAKVGFSQSYTYFTWRNTRKEISDYVSELVEGEPREYFRPNFWPNTPDILPEFLQYGGRPGFIIRLLLASTLSSNYGIYGPAFELLVDAALPGKEEYLDSEKYELKQWDWNREGHLRDLIARINRIRRENRALQTTWNVRFHECDNENILFHVKSTDDLSNVLLIAINLDPFRAQTGRLRVPLSELGIPQGSPYMVHDLLSDDKYIWHGEWNRVEIDPGIMPGHILRIHTRLRKEQDFDYFM
jgi:starch synthase (maltosyl-transferring)